MRLQSKHLLSGLCLLVLWGLLPLQEATAQYVHPSDDLFVGAPVMLTLPQARDTLQITYRPNSHIATTEIIPTDGPQRIRWTPHEAGVVALSTTHGGTQTVSVRFRSVPWGGILVLLFAGSILFGGMLFAVRTLFQIETPAGNAS